MSDITSQAAGDEPAFETECSSCQKPFQFRRADITIRILKAGPPEFTRRVMVECPHCKAWTAIDPACLD